MRNKRTKLFLIIGSVPFIIGTFSHSFAIVKKDAQNLSFLISAAPTKRLRFYTGHDGSSWSAFSDVIVPEGESASLSSIPTPSLSGYTFKGWNINVPSSSNYSVTYSSTEVSNLTINDDATFYSILESNTDYAYTNSSYYQAYVDVEINTSSIGATVLGKRYLGITGIPSPIADWNATRNLATSSGIYKFVNEGGGANLYRKVGFKPNNNWKGNWGSGTPAFFIHAWIDSSTSTDVLMGNSLTNDKLYSYIPATYQYLLFVRNDHNNTSIDWSNRNQSGDLDLSNSFMNSSHYSASSIVLEMDGSADWNGWTKNNSKWIS